MRNLNFAPRREDVGAEELLEVEKQGRRRGGVPWGVAEGSAKSDRISVENKKPNVRPNGPLGCDTKGSTEILRQAISYRIPPLIRYPNVFHL